ncbi:MAG: hypothetical protein HKN47_24680 [Pirellulaceae bacterium]|nr:hypothetical protein [Pirellulaceae bacterium]
MAESESVDAIGESIELSGGKDNPCLLTGCSASGDVAEAAQRHAMYPAAAAEDMEGFAVALSCRVAGVPVSIVRGISNRAGDRDSRNWQVESALDAVAALIVTDVLGACDG